MNAGSQTKILVVEDQAEVRDLAVSTLRDANYLVVEAANADEALAILQTTTDFSLLFTDIVMPGELNGIGLAQRVGRLQPALPVLFTSGYSVYLATDPIAAAAFLPQTYRPDQTCNPVGDLLPDHRS